MSSQKRVPLCGFGVAPTTLGRQSLEQPFKKWYRAYPLHSLSTVSQFTVWQSSWLLSRKCSVA